MSYKVGFRGATGGRIDPDRSFSLPGASHLFAGKDSHRNAFQLAPAGGQAASLPPDVLTALATDKSHHPQLDGHRDSAIASHPDGQFSMNTAASSDHSRHANYETFRSVLTGFDRTINAVTLEPVESRELGEPKSTLYEARSQRLWDQPELIVKDAAEGGSRVSSVLMREYSGSELAVGALGLYAAYSVLARA